MGVWMCSLGVCRKCIDTAHVSFHISSEMPKRRRRLAGAAVANREKRDHGRARGQRENRATGQKCRGSVWAALEGRLCAAQGRGLLAGVRGEVVSFLENPH